MKNNKHPFLKWAGVVFLVLGLIYAGVIVAGNMAVRREKAALEAAGFPMRLEQVIPAAIPEKDNAAPLYNAAFKALKEQPRLEFEGDDVGGTSSADLFGQLGQAAVAFLKAPDDVEAGQQSIAIEAMKEAAAVSAPSENVSQMLQKQLSSFNGEKSAALALNGERILCSEWAFSQSPVSLGKWMRKWSFGEEVSFPYSSTLASVVFGPLLQPWDNAAFLQASRTMFGSGEKAVSESDEGSYVQNIPGLFALTKYAIPSVQGVRSRLTHVESAALVARLGLAVINYKREHGVFPRDLQALGAQDLVDPFTGKSLVYRPEPNGFLLYSAGPDLTDDGGAEYDNKTSKGDIVWRYVEKAG